MGAESEGEDKDLLERPIDKCVLLEAADDTGHDRA